MVLHTYYVLSVIVTQPRFTESLYKSTFTYLLTYLLTVSSSCTLLRCSTAGSAVDAVSFSRDWTCLVPVAVASSPVASSRLRGVVPPVLSPGVIVAVRRNRMDTAKSRAASVLARISTSPDCIAAARARPREIYCVVRPSRTPSQLVSSTCSQTERSYSLHATLTLRALCCLWLSAVRAPTEPLLHMWCYGLVISKIRLRSINQWLNVRIFYSQKTAGNTTATKEKTGHVRITIIHGFG